MHPGFSTDMFLISLRDVPMLHDMLVSQCEPLDRPCHTRIAVHGAL